MPPEKRDIELGMSAVFDWSVWRSNESYTKRTLKTLKQEKIRFQTEYSNIAAAFETIEAFLQSALPEERLHCPQTYRGILKENPKNINALADMITANLISTSEKLNHISEFSKNLVDDKRHKIIGMACLELGMALVECDEIVDFEQMFTQRDRNEPIKQTLGDSVQIIEEIDSRMIKHLQYQSKNDLELPTADAYATLFSSTRISIARDRNLKAVLYLSEGLERHGSNLQNDELLIWKYYLAKAYRQLVSKSRNTGFEKHLHKEWRLKAMQLFYDVINGTDQMTTLSKSKQEILTSVKARSYVNIGEIIQQIPQGEDRNYYFSYFQDTKFRTKLEMSPSNAFEVAKSIRHDDIYVLVHYAIHLVHYTKDLCKDSVQQEHNIEKAIGMLTDAIEQDEDYCMAHAVRMKAVTDMYSINYHSKSRENNNLLKLAEKDGEFCFSSYPTVHSLLDFSRIMHFLAKEGKADANQDYLQKALDVLVHIELKFQHHNLSWVYKERATCHYSKREVVDALTYTEIAFYSNTKVKSWIYIKQLCNYFIEAIEGKKLEDSVLVFAFRRLKTAITTLLETRRVLAGLAKPGMPIPGEKTIEILEQSIEEYQNTFCREMLKKQTHDWRSIKGYVNDILFNLDKKTKEVTSIMEKTAENNPKLLKIIKSSPNVVEDVFVHKVLCHVTTKIEGMSVPTGPSTSVQSSPLNWTDEFVAPGTYIPSLRGHRQSFNQAGKRYDFFVLHSEADNDWVVCCLLQQLEYGHYGFKGCVRERDFEEGKTILENIKDKFNDSNKILVVITRKTPESFLQELDKHHILQSLDVSGQYHKDTYVVNVGVEKRPRQLINFPYINCGPLPLNLNEVRDTLALPRSTKQLDRPRVFIQPFRDQNDQRVEVLSTKCAVDEDRKITSSSILELGIPRVPIYEAVTQLGSAESTLEYGFPESDVLRLYERHVVCFDVQKRLAKWVAYKLTKDDIEGPGNKDDCRFKQDEKLPDEFQPTKSTFKDKFTKGHMVPAADSKSSQGAVRDTFKFTNIYPEYKNNKMWTAVEVYIREKVLEKFPHVWIYIIPAFKANDSDIVAFKTVGKTGVAVPSHMFKFVIAVSESGDGTLVTGAFRVRNAQDYGCTELKQGDSAFANVFENEVISDIGTIATDTGIRFDEMLKTKGHVYNEDLLKNCSFITADEFKCYEEKHIKDKIARKQKDKEQKSAK